MSELTELRERLREFASQRDWQRFHTPKNLAMALIGEAAEVVEHFQWLTPEQSAALTPEQRAAIELELADVLLYLVMLADKLDVDLGAAAGRKIAINAQKYPVSTARGSARKHPAPAD